MTAVQFARRTVGASMSVGVGLTALRAAAAATASNTFNPFTGVGLSTRSPHPVTGTLVDPTEDGQAASGNVSGGAGPAGNKVCIDWAGKGCYDPIGRKVMWAGTGAFGSVCDTPINTMALYDEATNQWSAVRSWTAGGETSSDNGSGHMYDGNCIDPTGRRFFKKKFERALYIRDLVTGSWSKVSYSSGEPSSYGHDAGMEYIPSLDRLWVRSIYSADDSSMLMELNPTTGAVTVLKSAGQIGSDALGSVCSFNPRAFSGAGACFVGGSNAYTVRTDTLAVQTNASGKPAAAGAFSIGAANSFHLCRDPVGDGWLYASTDGYMYRLTSAGVWSQRAQLPVELRNGSTWNWVMVPIDAESGDYGVVWIVTSQGIGSQRAWLYRP